MPVPRTMNKSTIVYELREAGDEMADIKRQSVHAGVPATVWMRW
jgi:hypothetical protein